MSFERLFPSVRPAAFPVICRLAVDSRRLEEVTMTAAARMLRLGRRLLCLCAVAIFAGPSGIRPVRAQTPPAAAWRDAPHNEGIVPATPALSPLRGGDAFVSCTLRAPTK